jgi:hypothetical protein
MIWFPDLIACPAITIPTQRTQDQPHAGDSDQIASNHSASVGWQINTIFSQFAWFRKQWSDHSHWACVGHNVGQSFG